jgi:hypothetical protein
MRLLPSTSHLPAQLDENSVAVRIGLWSRDPKRDGGRLESERTTIGPGLDRKQKQSKAASPLVLFVQLRATFGQLR